ncbi:RTA-like protein [Macrophomina phaseolina MS6]|uniref:RTA-like protein n=1 Tax=Macrophomina phaseolina (strain MS6) TaxID=1126212 RepID=K2RBB7_MACPH|nr:RTA-like protein [Macrophomina phaseolina MS6]
MNPAGETFGYYGRVWASEDIHRVKPFILQVLLILAAPAWLCATIHMALGRVIRVLDAGRYSLIGVSWLTKICVLIDFLVFFTQVAGAVIQSSGDRVAMAAGNKAILGGLVFQLFAFCFFILITWRVHSRLSREPTDISLTLNWQKYMHAINIASIAIFVRSLVRAVEYAQAGNSAIAQHEAFIYIFDALLMWFAMVVTLLFHPGQLIKTAMRRMEGIYSGREMQSCDD